MRVALALCLPPIAVSAQNPVRSRTFLPEKLHAPPGFTVEIYARVNGSPRHMTFDPNGALYVAAYGTGRIVAIPKRGETVKDGVVRFPHATPDDFVIRSGGRKILSLPSGGRHSSRTIDFGPDGHIYVTTGSTCNFCVESDPRRAAMRRYDDAGSNETIFAAGLRNTVSFAWHPVTGELWSVDNGGDGLGDDAPPEEIDIPRAGGDYGWPDCVGQRYTDAPIGFHGSWNRNVLSGYKVIRVPASSGRAAGTEDFLWGFFDPATRSASGRPVEAITGPDGAVYVSDDAMGNIYRVSYEGPRMNPAGMVNRGAGIFKLYGQRLSRASLYGGENQIDFVLPDVFRDAVSGEVAIRLP